MVVERQCPVCGATYEVNSTRLKHGRQTTCSRKCSYSLRATKKSTSITGICAVCGKSATKAPSHVAQSKAESMFCSRACAYKARSLGLVSRVVLKPYNIPEATRKASAERMKVRNARRKAEGRYGHTEETKAKLSRATSRAIAEGRMPRVSKAEQRVGPVLDTLGIAYKAQYGIRGARGRFAVVVDYFLPGMNTALEFNGTFWHADPRVYPKGPVHASQRRTADRYKRKSAFLASHGIRLVEVWEMDFNKDPEKSVRAAIYSSAEWVRPPGSLS